jgi:CBS domain-containing protein
MLVETILKEKGRDVATVRPDLTLHKLAQLLTDRRIGAAVVTDAQGRMVGIVSERDLMRAVAREGERALGLPVSEVMTREVRTCRPEDTVEHLMGMMTSGRMRHLPVVVDGKLEGIVSVGDVVKNRIQESELEARALRDYVMAG